ncbi:hypothetical protein [Actinoplanes sp. NPDC051494]|uniref:hypothetical protein n=1 Tax=Actinoplanes sp. NPDC051494 TaxID=3363907 RepID=UPI0037B63CE0
MKRFKMSGRRRVTLVSTRNSSSGSLRVISTTEPCGGIEYVDQVEGGGPMRSYAFIVVLSRRPTDEDLGRLLAAGPDDATFGAERGVPVVEFDREAANLAEAIASARPRRGSVDAGGRR